MKIIICMIALFFSCFASAEPVKFQLDGLPVSQVVRVIYSDALKTPYVLDPAVLADVRPMSFRFDSAKGRLDVFLAAFLDSLGYRVDKVAGVDFVRSKPAADAAPEVEKDSFVYRPKYRDGSYLVDLLSPLFKGQFTAKKMVQAAPGDKAATANVPAGSAAAQIDRSSDTLVFSGSAGEVAKLQKLLAQVDVSSGEVLVRGVIYEVNTGSTDGNAFSVAASVLRGSTTVGLKLRPAAPLDSVLSFTGANWNAVISALNSDNRFKVVSSPSARVRSGAQARFVVGQDVPVLGSVSYPQGAGQAVQSVSYQSSGVIFQITPKVRDSVVDVDLTQQTSFFITTTTGVNSSPTLTKRQLDTSVSMADGDLIMLGGLTEDKDTASSTGLPFLPDFLRSKSDTKSKTEILLLLQLTKI